MRGGSGARGRAAYSTIALRTSRSRAALILPRPLAMLSGGLFMLFLPAYEKNWLDGFWILLPWSSVA